jgi:NADPH:quinone reductase-like Zn-dependent oxidoreductase
MSTEMLTTYIGENIGLGGYSEYTLADEQLCFKLPPGLAREEAVTTPFGACVAYLGLFSKSCLNVDIKRGPNASVLIWGGSCELQIIASNSLI